MTHDLDYHDKQKRTALPSRTLFFIMIACGAVVTLLLNMPVIAVFLLVLSFACGLVDRSGWLDRKQRDSCPGQRGKVHLGLNRLASDRVCVDRNMLEGGLCIFGTTGAGKTELLIDVVDDRVAAGEGIIYFDGRGDFSIFAKLCAVAAIHSREDDVRGVTFLQGNSQGALVGFDALQGLSRDEIASVIEKMVKSRLGESSWTDRHRLLAHACVDRMIQAQGRATIAGISDFCELNTLFAADGTLEDVPESISDYLGTIPGYDLDRGVRQATSAIDFHIQVAASIQKTFLLLGKHLSFCLSLHNPNIDIGDIVAGRRLLYLGVCSLELSPDELGCCSGVLGAVLGIHLDRVSCRDAREAGNVTLVFDEAKLENYPLITELTTGRSTQRPAVIYSNQGFFRDVEVGQAFLKSLNPSLVALMKVECSSAIMESALRSGGHVFIKEPDKLDGDLFSPRDIRGQQPGEFVLISTEGAMLTDQPKTSLFSQILCRSRSKRIGSSHKLRDQVYRYDSLYMPENQDSLVDCVAYARARYVNPESQIDKRLLSKSLKRELAIQVGDYA